MMESGFPCFPRLPDELRIFIWKLAVPTETRVFEVEGIVNLKDTVPIAWSTFSYSRSLRDQGYECLPLRRFKFKYAHPVPAILHTCGESRYVGKRFYFLFSCRLWFNPAVDTIYFNSVM
jgi:hypothetical protein